jgi:hypothetical protein
MFKRGIFILAVTFLFSSFGVANAELYKGDVRPTNAQILKTIKSSIGCVANDATITAVRGVHGDGIVRQILLVYAVGPNSNIWSFNHANLYKMDNNTWMLRCSYKKRMYSSSMGSLTSLTFVSK